MILPVPLPVTRGFLACILAMCGCTPIAERRTENAHPKIVSLNPCSDAILARVADPDQLLAVSHYSHDPQASSMPLAEARRYRTTGGTVEEVLALDPDLVVGDAFMAPATRAAFVRLGIPVETFAAPVTVAESEAQVRRMAALVGHPERGERLVGEIEAGLRQSHRTGARPSALLWQQGGLVPGSATLVAQLLGHAGFASHSAARGLGQGAYLPLEQVLADPPQAIIAAGSERMLAHPVLDRLQGVAVVRLEPNLLYCGGPTIPRLAARLAEIRDGLKAPPPTPSSEEEGALLSRASLPLLFRGGGRGVVEAGT